MKVSFDFDATLSNLKVQEYAKELISKGVEVWICTSRFKTVNAPNPEWNDDLLKVADEVGINRDNIIFTEHANKSEYLDGKGFVWHLDDDWIELSFIKTDTDLVGISVFGGGDWKRQCNNLL